MKPLVVIIGPNASGKSSIGMELARAFDGEIIAADSRTIYKGMDIGTGKPSKIDQQEIAHHGLDLVKPGERFTAADFQKYARNIIDDIHKRNKLPIMIGGTGLYIDGVIFNFSFAKQSSIEERAELETLTDTELRTRVEQLGAEGINMKNRRHLIRFLETGGTPKDEKVLRENTIVFGVERTKNELRSRIEERVEQMFRAGLRKEVDSLVKQYGWGSEALTGIGYREFQAFYEEGASMSRVKRQIIQGSLQYAKRQRTWFTRNQYIRWVSSAEAALLDVANFLGVEPSEESVKE